MIDYHSGKTWVMLLGDSFLFGILLDAQETIPAFLERKLSGYELYNLGIPGWGLDQMYLSYKKYVTLIKPQIIVLLYIDDDLSRSYEAFREPEGMNKPSFSLQENRLVPRTPLSLWKRYVLHNHVINNSIIANRFYIFYKNIEIKKLADALFADLIAQTHERRQELIVLRLPLLRDGPPTWNFKDFFAPPMWNFKEFFAEKNNLYIDVGDQMPRDAKFYMIGGHFSAEGTAYVAELISKLDMFTRRRNLHSPY